MSAARKLALRAAVALVFGCFSSASGCAEPIPLQTYFPPDEKAFPPVLDALERRCATLDCHGASGRNLRLYTGSGLRLDPKDVPGTGQTTPAEYDASYWSVYGLEPEAMNAVIRDGGKDPERLSLVRKGRDTEHHKGGAILVPGDDADTCLLSWLASKLDEKACKAAAEFGAPDQGSSGGP